MKKLLYILVLVVSNWSIRAQYHPMLNNSSWIIHIYPFIGPEPYYDTIYEGNDVIIGSYIYTTIHDPVYGHDLYFREDVNAQKVYQYVDGNDIIVFDFSLQVSDLITFENGVTYTVTSVTTVNVADGTRKAMTLNSFLGEEYWIEGVGSNRHPLISHIVFSDPDVTLSCSYQNGLNVYSALNSNCESILTSVRSNPALSKVNVTPNPFSGKASILINRELENGTLKICNLVGGQVREIERVHGKEIIIERGHLKNGIYFVQLYENDVLFTTKKIIIGN